MKLKRRKNKHSVILSSFLCGFLMFFGIFSGIKADDDPQDYFDAGSAKIKITRIKERGNSEKKGRQYVTVFLIVAIFIGFGALLFNMQIVNGEQYALEGSASVSVSNVNATRGEILDRNGNVLVGNRQGNAIIFDATEFPSYEEQEKRNEIILSLINLFEKNYAEWINEFPIYINADGEYDFVPESEYEIKKMLGEDMLDLNRYATAEDCMKQLIEKYKLQNYSQKDALNIASVCYQMKLNVFNSANPYRFAEDVDSSIVAYIKELSSVYQGVDVQIETYREYLDGTLAPHIIGMVGAIDAEEYAELKEKGYAMNDVVGKSGIEQIMEDYLKGEDGEKTVTVNSDGAVKTEYTKEVKNGNSIVLTLDAPLQKIAQDALKEKCDSIESLVPHGGAVVALNCNTGEVLAMATYPSYDITTYTDDYSKLVKNKASPLWNRAIQSIYAPGSTSKPSTAIAALEEGVIDENTSHSCHYSYRYLDMTFSCIANHADSNIDVRQALQDSCNIFFYKVSQDLGVEKMNTYRELLGLGQPTGIELKENTGVLDSPSYRTSINQTWRPGFTLQSAIGQAANLFTPLQLANYCATIANGGTRYNVNIIKEIKSFDLSESVLVKEPSVAVETGISPENIKIVQQGMKRVVTKSYTLTNGIGKVVDCAAKTGTSQVEHNINGTKKVLTNGFFITFAPYDEPEIAIAVAIEGGQSGASCSSVAQAIYEEYFKSQQDSTINNQTGELIG
ncbi:MAG: hypothetical protein IJZ57_03655 [Clostridia bacterium]|nr:hypothetical protein [Clostridia bacterium]